MTPIEIARLQIGVCEYPSGSNRVVYNRWFYGTDVHDGLWGTTFPWCMVFVQWCFAMAGAPLPYKTASCSKLLEWYKQHQPECVGDTPHPGDIVIYEGHTGLVESAESDGTFVAIEGNTSQGGSSNGGQVLRMYRKKAKAFITTKEGDSLKRYDRLEDVPPYYYDETRRLIERGALKGRADGNLDVSEDMLRVLIICQRMTDKAE